MTTNTLPLSYPLFKFGYELKLLARADMNAIFQCCEGTHISGFLVCTIKVLPKWKGYPKREGIPSKSRGGFEVWFFMKGSKDMAWEKWGELIKNR